MLTLIFMHLVLYVIGDIERMTSESPVTRIEFGMPHGPEGSVKALQLLGERVLPHVATQRAAKDQGR